MSASTPKGPDAPAWTRRGDDPARSWGREKETGNAFRGVSRGRGRGGVAGRGRTGGRGGGGRSISTRGTPDSRSTPPPLPEKAAAVGGPVVNNNALLKGREATKPSTGARLTVDSWTSQSSDSNVPSSPNKPSRRRRNTHKRAVSAALPKPLSVTLTDGLPASPSVPLIPSTKETKNSPPYTSETANSEAPVHDLRQEITHLVDHVRSMAMDNKRPSSPNTHIDWAGDDDDSLPDLDDWGVSSKLTSEPDGMKANLISIDPKLPEPAASPVPEKLEAAEQTNDQLAVVGGVHSSPESPIETSSSLSPPPPARRERERRRERGSRRDKEKRALQVNGFKSTLVPSNTAAKKSLLERLSSPVRPEPLALPQESEPVPGRNQRTVDSTSGTSSLHHPSLPPKPASVPNKPSLSFKDSGPWRNNQQNTQTQSSQAVPSSETDVDKAGNETTKGKGHDVSAEPYADPPPGEQKEEASIIDNKSSFDWSEEPVAFETPLVPKAPSVAVEPASPVENISAAPLPSTTPRTPSPQVPVSISAKPDTSASPRSRSQRPLSGDVTPSPRRDRSPYKTHNPRNHSAPHAALTVGSGSRPSPGGRTRPQHASRPILRFDALQMIERSLRDEPHPRRESPPVTKATE